MFSAVIVDDPNTNLYIGGDLDKPFPLLDLSENLVVLTRTGLTGSSNDVEFGDDDTVFPTIVEPTDDLTKSLLTTFYVITDPNNWRDYQQDNWNISLPPVLVTTNTEELAVALPYNTATTQFAAGVLGLTNSTGNGPTLAQIAGLEMDKIISNPEVEDPSIGGIGEVWINTQFERTVNKNHPGTPSDKPGTITVIDTDEWNVERKIALPEINMNHPHNMWTDTKNEVVYQTQWFGKEMAVIDRESGELIKEVFTGQSPSHVMTSPATGSIYVAVNGEETVNEFDPVTYDMTRQLSTGFRSHPHGHWVSSSGQYVVTPDFIGLKATILDLESGSATSSDNVLFGPIATGMKGDESVFYTADFLGNSMTAIDPSNGEILSNIDWLEHGLVGLPIQAPISPDDQYMVVALTLGGKIGVVDVSSSNPEDHYVTEILDCDPGCHGVQWGAKDGGGYYAYVSSKFSNVLTVVDPNPDGDVETDDAEIAGRILLADNDADSDDRVIGYEGFGGQGVLAIPNVYEGWIQKTVTACENSSDPCGDVSDFIQLPGFTQDHKNPNP